jgi:iron complex transport system ATP-binding protein
VTPLAAEHITLTYRANSVIRDLTMTVERGELVGLIGPNGAGKTTVLRALGGLMRPAVGRVLLGSEDVYQMASMARARVLGIIPQGETQVWPLTVEEMVRLGRTPHRGWLLPLRSTDHQVVNQALALTGLSGLHGRSIQTLSGGERQRVYIARALAQEPQVLLLDEPTANLDIHYQMHLLGLVKQLVASRRLTAVIAIHDLALAARYCDRLLLLHKGHLLACGTPERVLTQQNLCAAFGIEAELYRDPRGQWALTIQPMNGQLHHG